jgi:squalene synthase HpnC
MGGAVLQAQAPAATAWWPTLPELQRRARGENFTVASLLLGRQAARHLRAIYLYARLVDECGDAAPGDRPLVLDRVEGELERAYAGTTTDPVFHEVGAAARACALPREPFLRLIDANRRDQLEPVYETYEELLGYCRLSANPVGELVLHVFGAATPDRIALSDRVCTALQLVEHWQDVRGDAEQGRIYLPAEDRRAFGVAEPDLTEEHAGDSLRQLLAFETRRADELLAEGAALIGRLSGRARLAVAGYVAGGRAAIEAIERADYDVLAAVPRPGRFRRALATAVALAR